MKPRNFPGRKERRYIRATRPPDGFDYWPKDIRIRIGAKGRAQPGAPAWS